MSDTEPTEIDRYTLEDNEHTSAVSLVVELDGARGTVTTIDEPGTYALVRVEDDDGE